MKEDHIQTARYSTFIHTNLARQQHDIHGILKDKHVLYNGCTIYRE